MTAAQPVLLHVDDALKNERAPLLHPFHLRLPAASRAAAARCGYRLSLFIAGCSFSGLVVRNRAGGVSVLALFPVRPALPFDAGGQLRAKIR